MCLSKAKKLCVESDSQMKQSFDERFNDDLCEDILQYLPLKDKLRLESVSKHFQRNIYQRQHYLWIIEDNSSSDYFFIKKEFNLKAFESVLKKCPNIKSIVIRLKKILSSPELHRLLSEKIIDLIYKNCNNLIEFNTDLAFDEILWNKLITKIDSKAFTLHLDRKPKYEINCETLSFHRQLNIKCIYRSIYPMSDRFQVSDLVGLNSITTLHISISGQQINDFKTLVENNKRIKFLTIFGLEFSSRLMIEILNIISKLKDLVKLKINSKMGLNESFLNKSLQQIADNCLKLKSISCNLMFSTDPLSSLKVFKSLKRLQINNSEINSFDLFKGFEGLTHLKFKSLESNDLKGMDVFLPKIRSLVINSTLKVTEETIETLGRLSDLELIDIKVDNKEFKENIETKLMKNCRRIKTIKVLNLHKRKYNRNPQNMFESRVIGVMAGNMSAPFSIHETAYIVINSENYSHFFGQIYDTLNNAINGDITDAPIEPITRHQFILVCRYLLKSRVDHVYMAESGVKRNDFISDPIDIEVPYALAHVINGIGCYVTLNGGLKCCPQPEDIPKELNEEFNLLVNGKLTNGFSKLIERAKTKNLIKTDYISLEKSGKPWWTLSVRKVSNIEEMANETQDVIIRSFFPFNNCDAILAAIVQNSFNGNIYGPQQTIMVNLANEQGHVEQQQRLALVRVPDIQPLFWSSDVIRSALNLRKQFILEA